MNSNENTSKTPANLMFHGILSKNSCYGLIWRGTYLEKEVAIKMVMLDSGLHYDHRNYLYRDVLRQIESSVVPAFFTKNDEVPFYHREFVLKRSMSTERFYKEAASLIELAKHEIAPNVHDTYIIKDLECHYGFIVMDLCDCSVKDLLLKRDLFLEEEEIIKAAIDRLHNKLGYVHGDMKPSNMGVFWREDKRIGTILFLDCGKIQSKETLADQVYENKLRHDWDIYRKHSLANRQLGKSS